MFEFFPFDLCSCWSFFCTPSLNSLLPLQLPGSLFHSNHSFLIIRDVVPSFPVILAQPSTQQVRQSRPDPPKQDEQDAHSEDCLGCYCISSSYETTVHHPGAAEIMTCFLTVAENNGPWK